MTLSNNNQFVHEHYSLKIKLEHFQQENVLLKYRLSKMVDDNEGNKFLQMAEYFQNELLIIDVMLEKLFNDHDKFAALIGEIIDEKMLPEKINKDYNTLKNSFSHFEKKFLNLLKEFNEKMSENNVH